MFDSSTLLGQLILATEIGLAAAFWTDVFTESTAAPKWVVILREKLRKPFGCRVCMSWWCSFFFWSLVFFMGVYEYKHFDSVVVFFILVPASAFVSLVCIALLRKLDTLIF